jgi:hypothetical protein
MTIQEMTLTNSMAIGLSPNPFYRKTKEQIIDNLEYAKECYNKLIPNMINYWCIIQCYENGIITGDDPYTVFKEKEKILDAIREHKIKPFPNELKEIK